jgi:hypothetical protein
LQSSHVVYWTPGSSLCRHLLLPQCVRKGQDTDGVSQRRTGLQTSGRGGSLPVASVAAFPCNRWQACPGISGSLRLASVAAVAWHQWQRSCGIAGSFAVASVAGLAWNTHTCGSSDICGSGSINAAAQFIGVCSSSTLAAKLSISSVLRRQSRENRRVSLPCTRTHIYQLQPTTHCCKLSETRDLTAGSALSGPSLQTAGLYTLARRNPLGTPA